MAIAVRKDGISHKKAKRSFAPFAFGARTIVRKNKILRKESVKAIEFFAQVRYNSIGKKILENLRVKP
jgi:hypothetical protein